MKRMLKLEYKRILTSRHSILLLTIAVILTVVFALLVISYPIHTYLDESGEKISVTGIEAIRANQEMYRQIEGEVTPEQLRSLYETYHEKYAAYGDNIPSEVYYQEIYPVTVLLRRVNEIYVNEDTGIILSRSEISPENAYGFYEKRFDRLKEYLSNRYKDNPEVQDVAVSMLHNVSTPFVYIYGVGDSDVFDYLTVCIFLVTLVCVGIIAPVFSSDYQTGADDLQRCCRYGRQKLALGKMLIAMLFAVGLFVVCATIFLGIVVTAFGWDSLATSMGVVCSALSLPNLSVGGIIGIILASGLLSLLAMICFTLYLSARNRTPFSVLMVAGCTMFLPTVHMLLGGRLPIETWISLALPSAGVGFGSNVYYELINFSFLQAGSAIIWSPYLITAFAVLEAILFFVIANRAYNRHEAD